jgi:hypothetical protein
MKKTELKEIIRKEVREALDPEFEKAQDKLYTSITGKEPGPQGLNKFKPIYVSSVKGEPAVTSIESIDDLKYYIEQFKKIYNEEPSFDKSGKRWERSLWVPTNPKFLEKKKLVDKGYQSFGTKGD